MKPTISYDMPFSAYLELEAISKSELDHIHRTPAHFQWARANRDARRETPAMLLGRAVHAATFEPFHFANWYAAAPDVDRRTKAGKATYDEFLRLAHYALKSRPDYVIPGDAVVDIKTTDDARPEAFSRAIHRFRYHVQAAFYIDACNAAKAKVFRFVFVVVERTPPFACAVYEITESAIDQGRREYLADLALYDKCARTRRWPAYPGLRLISLPSWGFDS